MTHTLHPEIEALEIELLRKFNKDPQDDRTIREILEKYLKMPQPIENEPVCAVCGGLGVRENHQATNAQEQFVECRGCKEDKEPLPEKDLSGEIVDGLNKLYGEEQKQSTPQIEKIELILDGTRPTNTLLTDANMSRIDTMLSQIIDYINNTLPPSSSNE